MASRESLEPTLSRAWWRARLAHDLPASLVVFLVALPLCMGIAIASGAPVTAGLVTGIVGGIVTGLIAGSPLQVSGPAAGLTVIVYQCVQEHGIELLGIVVLAAGALQVLAGMLRLGQWFRAVSPAVVQGMLAGIGVLIFSSQFHVMVDDKPRSSGVVNIRSIPEAIEKAWPVRDERDEDTAPGTRTARLRERGMLHLSQMELDEQVHHLLAGVASAADDARLDTRSESPAEETQAVHDREVAERLRGLAASQQAVFDQLEVWRRDSDTAPLLAAHAACHEALADLRAGNIHTARVTQARAVAALAELRDAAKDHRAAAAVGVLTIIVLVLWQSLVARRVRFIPAPLAGVLAATLLTFALDLPVLFVEVPDNLLEEVYLPSLDELWHLLDPALLLMAVQIAVVASAETLLCATAVDQLHRGPRTRYDRELVAQGVGNMVCGSLAALPMTGVIVRSSANVNAGARSRWSAVLHGVWLLLFVAFLSFVLRRIPTASLGAILVYTGYKLVNVKTIRNLLAYGAGEAAIYVATMVSIVATDLLTGVLIGIGLSIAKLLYTFSRLKVKVIRHPEENRATLKLRGSATFLRLPRLAQILDEVEPGTELHVEFEQLTYIDHACLDLLMNWETQHAATGGRLVIDWGSLTARFAPPGQTGGGTVDGEHWADPGADPGAGPKGASPVARPQRMSH